MELAVLVDGKVEVAVRDDDRLRVAVVGDVDELALVLTARHVHREVVRLSGIVAGTLQGVVVVGGDQELAVIGMAHLGEPVRQLGEEPVHVAGGAVLQRTPKRLVQVDAAHPDQGELSDRGEVGRTPIVEVRRQVGGELLTVGKRPVSGHPRVGTCRSGSPPARGTGSPRCPGGSVGRCRRSARIGRRNGPPDRVDADAALGHRCEATGAGWTG